jgi:hypothetical protein
MKSRFLKVKDGSPKYFPEYEVSFGDVVADQFIKVERVLGEVKITNETVKDIQQCTIYKDSNDNIICIGDVVTLFYSNDNIKTAKVEFNEHLGLLNLKSISGGFIDFSSLSLFIDYCKKSNRRIESNFYNENE